MVLLAGVQLAWFNIVTCSLTLLLTFSLDFHFAWPEILCLLFLVSFARDPKDVVVGFYVAWIRLIVSNGIQMKFQHCAFPRDLEVRSERCGASVDLV